MKLKSKELLIIGVLVVSLMGCGSKDKAPTEEVTAIPTIEATESDEEQEGEPGSIVDEDAQPSSLDDKDTGEFVEEDVPQTSIEDIGGEGIVDDILPDLTGMEESPVGEPVMFTDATGADNCLFAIESVEASDMKIENIDDVTDKKVVVVSYSYKNMASEGNLLFDDMSFKLLANDTVCMPYFSPELTPAAPSGVGETAFGQVAFLAPKDCQDVIVVFDNASIDAKTIFKATIK